MNEKMNEVFMSYNEMIQDNECESSDESYKDVNQFLENSGESNFQYSNQSQNSSIATSHSTDGKNIPICSYVSNNFTSKRENKYKKYYTASYINNMNSAESFPFKDYGCVPSTRDKTKIVKNFHWKPLGKNVPQIDKINLSYKRAWDIGKAGCNGLLIKNLFESYKKKKLNYMVLDGTNIEIFLTVYSHSYQEAIRGVTPSVLRTFSFYDLENAYFIYDVKSIQIFRKIKEKDKEKKSVMLRGLNDNFFNAILVCMYEIAAYLNFVNSENIKMNKHSSEKKKKKNEKQNETTYYVKSVRNKHNAYNRNIKDVISLNRKKKIMNNALINGASINNALINGATINAASIKEEMGKRGKKDFPKICKNINTSKIYKTSNTVLASNNNEEFGYEYIKDIIKKEEKELYETDKMYNNSNDEYSSHTSDSMQ
ncbi:hypothetical protein, conserved [Plasmodium gonderi]|uniref:Uncharacterized protein n=1 Tax=Plasmodium gonderi TaxID=77519 RepID=A0A1Y1JM37_PLAGO|nr:hypothetical protein, conserved [Plasmodium gonderi]GAW81134.1 hypothetical protein, conserved [Plasmodium gonderi]